MSDGGYENPDNSRSYEGYSLVDARIGVRSERLRLSVFGRNLGDKTYLANIVSANEFYTDPRVIGAELGWEF
jgi:outer membrane receptor for ferric coprogen and ferric-rhodotorulic acid